MLSVNYCRRAEAGIGNLRSVGAGGGFAAAVATRWGARLPPPSTRRKGRPGMADYLPDPQGHSRLPGFDVDLTLTDQGLNAYFKSPSNHRDPV